MNFKGILPLLEFYFLVIFNCLELQSDVGASHIEITGTELWVSLQRFPGRALTMQTAVRRAQECRARPLFIGSGPGLGVTVSWCHSSSCPSGSP